MFRFAALDLSRAEVEIARRREAGDSVDDIAHDFGVPRRIIHLALGATPDQPGDGAYPHRLHSLALRRPGLFWPSTFDPESEVVYADGTPGPDTDDIEDPFGPLGEFGGA